MPRIFPFKAVRPAEGMELQVSASTHGTDNQAQLKEVEQNPFTYLHVVKPHLHFNEEKQPGKHFPLAKSYMNQLIAQGILVLQKDACFYIYKQSHKNNKSFTGIIATVSAKDYFEGRIKIHEKTLTEKEDQLVEHIRITGAIGEPVLLTYHHNNTVDKVIANSIQNTAATTFEDTNGTLHEIWPVCDTSETDVIASAFSEINNFYIADGHHRSAAAATYFKTDHKGEGSYLAYLIPDSQLHIDSFHRIITKINSFDKIGFMEKLNQYFIIEPSEDPVRPASKYEFGLCLKGEWFRLQLRPAFIPSGTLESLAVSVLETYALKNVLGITDSKTDERLKFIPGKTPLDILEKNCGSGEYLMGFTVSPCSISEVFAIADEHLIMPPKSTYIEPKLRTGLIIQAVN